MMKVLALIALIGVSNPSLFGCSSDANTPELRTALERARPDNVPPTLRIAKTPLPMEGASAHTTTETVELSLKLAGRLPHTLAITMKAVRGAWRDGARFRVRQSRRWLKGTAPTAAGLNDAREAVFDGVRFVSRRGYSAWRELEIWRGDHHAWLRDAYALADAIIEAYEPAMTLTRRGTATVAGVQGETLDVSFKPQPTPSRTNADELTTLRDSVTGWAQWLATTHRATRVKGALTRRAGDDEILSGHLKISGPVEVEGTSGSFSLNWRRTVKDAPADLATQLTVPKEHVEPARRHRPWVMIRSVLKSELADVYARRAGR